MSPIPTFPVPYSSWERGQLWSPPALPPIAGEGGWPEQLSWQKVPNKPEQEGAGFSPSNKPEVTVGDCAAQGSLIMCYSK